MSSSVPYLLRGIYEWINDNNQTPYLVVDATVEGVEVPAVHVKDGQIILNVSFSAVHELSMTNEYVMFSARFDGVSRDIIVPIGAVLGIITRESGEGMWFPRDDESPEDPNQPPTSTSPTTQPPKPPEPKPPGNGGPKLKVVK